MLEREYMSVLNSQNKADFKIRLKRNLINANKITK